MPIAAAPAARAAFFATRLAFGSNVFVALVVLLDFDLVRPRLKEDFDFVRRRFDEDLDLVRLTLFFMIPLSM